MSTEWIINATEAYASLGYPGNLYDILNNFSPKTRSTDSNLSRTQTNTIASPPKVYIDNQALNGFIDFFKKQDCVSECSHCRYCQEIADKVVKLDHAEADKYISALTKLLDDLSSSNMFQVADLCPASKISTKV